MNPNQWNARDTQRSAVLRLTAGQPYALDALLQEIGGGDHLSLGWAYEEPVALQSTAIGSPVTQDWTTTADGKIQVTVEAGDITATADRFGFHQRAWTGDGEIVARVETMNNPYGWAKVGVMLRAGLEPDAAHAMIVRTPANGMAFQRRKTNGAGTANTNGGPIREWIKLTRKGETITASTSADGEYWEAFGSDTFPGLPVSVLVGLAASDITAATTSPVTATISHWSVQPLVAAEGIPSTALLPLQADPADMDADDLPDAWESTHDLDPAIAIGVHGPYGDPDMDGIAKLRGDQFGSDPLAVGGGRSLG